MAKQCSICGKPFGRFERPDGMFGVFDICSSCISEIKRISKIANSKDFTSYFEAKKSFYEQHKDSLYIENLLLKMDDIYEITDNESLAKLRLEAQKKEIILYENAHKAEENASKLLITTGSYFDGYVIDKYIDVIHEELIFKNSFIKQLCAGFEDLASFLSFQERELTGTNSLISRAHSVLMQKFRLRAAEIGANAILGIDFETSFGSDVVCAAVNGTAVVIRKKDEV